MKLNTENINEMITTLAEISKLSGSIQRRKYMLRNGIGIMSEISQNQKTLGFLLTLLN